MYAPYGTTLRMILMKLNWISVMLVLLMVSPAFAVSPDLSMWYTGDNGMAQCPKPPSEAPVDQHLSWSFTSAVAGNSTETFHQQTSLSVSRTDGPKRTYSYGSSITTDAPGQVQGFESILYANVTPVSTDIQAAATTDAYNGIGYQQMSSHVIGSESNETYIPFNEQVTAGQSWNQDGTVSVTAVLNAQEGMPGIPVTMQVAGDIEGFRATYYDYGTISQISPMATGNTTDTAFSETSTWSNLRTVVKQGKSSGVFVFKSKHGSVMA